MSEFPNPDETLEISAEAVSSLRETAPESFVLVDCRESDELEICKLDRMSHLPLSSFPDVGMAFAKSGDSEKPVVVYCHHGMRSQHAAQFLRQAGLKNTFSMTGGIEHWAVAIDPATARY